DWPLAWCAELDREASERTRARGGAPVWRVTFAPLLERTAFGAVLQRMLRTLEAAYAYPVDIEFTAHLAADGTPTVSLVQCRPLQTLGPTQRVELPETVAEQRLFFATRGHFMGGNIDQPLSRVIRVDGGRYGALSRTQKFAVGRLVGHFNRALATRAECPTLLIGPGRWGSSTPELGVPIRFADINRMAVIAEVAEIGAGMTPDLSFGSHFFQDLVESGIAYVALFPQQPGHRYHPDWFERLPAASHIAAPADTDAEVAASVSVVDVRATGLRLSADVVQQRLLCYQPVEP
ncbi:MAG: PEP/pyruvate-binding domain-containing protein, partial [Halochromatium sp.]